MQVKNLFTDEDAVSPVIGVILMVAITVILAAVIGAFVLGIGGSQEKVPQASFSWEGDGGEPVTVTHEGGDAITTDLTLSWGSGPSTTTWSATSSNPINAGDSQATSSNVAAGTEVQLIWESTTSDNSQVLSSYTP